MIDNPINPLPSLSIVVPVYNGSDTLPALVEQLMQVLPSISRQYEVILVNDGSQDNSWEVIHALCADNPRLRGINLLRNFGQHNAVLCGIRSAKNEIIITMDDDLQHPPDQIPLLLEKLNTGCDVVYGLPRKMPHSPFRNFASWMVKRVLSWVMGIKTIKDLSAFRAFRARLVEVFRDYRSPGVIIDVMLSWGTTRFGSVTVTENPRESGQSNYTFRKLFRQTFLILTGFSTIPLRFASILGFAFTLFGFGVLVYVLVVYFTQGSIPGFPFLASIISLFSGIQLTLLGVLGEYIARIFDRSLDRPPYFIGETIN
jgi:glycosyltransferase involved in cell wall biosynthesis